MQIEIGVSKGVFGPFLVVHELNGKFNLMDERKQTMNLVLVLLALPLRDLD